MQRRIDDQLPPGQRRVLPGDSFPRVIAPGGPQRFDGTENSLSGLQFPLSYSQMGQPSHLPHSVAAATLTSVSHGAVGPNPSMHQPPVHQAAASVPGQAQSLGGPQQQQQFQRLKVEDALSYLDQVKLQFGNQPQVYNDFLDIMKEFKSQTIDTPGVINRVSNLFKGHPDLIVGFNTFLPPGYKIEVEREVISVYQPGQQVMSIAALAQNASLQQQQQQQQQNQQQKPPTHLSSVPIPPHQPPPPPPPVHHSYHQVPRPTVQEVASAMANPPQPNVSAAPTQTSSQPVEFNHAINYVNKIKNRFQGQPEVYKQFLEILHTYQKEQRNIKEGVAGAGGKPLTETEVYSQVAKLFHNQEDLLAEFGQFLPDANGGNSTYTDMALGVRNDHSSTVKKPGFGNKTPVSKIAAQIKRPLSTANTTGTTQPPPAKVKRRDSKEDDDCEIFDDQVYKFKTGVLKDVSLAEAAKYGSLTEFAYFDKVRKALRHPEVYDNFLRCLILFNSEVISRSDLITMVHPFLSKFPDLFKWFKDFLGYKESGNNTEALPQGATKERSIRDEYNMEIDFSTCKRYGASYRALPASYPQPKCSGRTQLCREVLNDTWVSIPTWSEDSTFVTSKKTQYEEYIYKCEDERFELDYVIETNLATIKVLEGVQKKLQRMTPEEAAKFRLDNTLGGTSEVLTKKAICRIYGDKSADILDGLKKNPCVAVPLVLRRLKAKDEEWREHQKNFNKIWKDQNEKYYLKSLDHQGMTFKQNDIKALRSKSLINEIETILEEQNEHVQQGVENLNTDPHLREKYEDKTVFDDAASIIIHHMKRQTSVHAEDKKKIKVLMYHTIRDLFFYPRGELSDDEDDMDIDEVEDRKPRQCGENTIAALTESASKLDSAELKVDKEAGSEVKVNGIDVPTEKLEGVGEHLAEMDSGDGDIPELEDDDTYNLIYGNNNWYLFFRLHHKLCARLLFFRNLSHKIAQDELNSKSERKHSTSVALRLRSPFDVEPEQYYTYFLELIKNLMDCSVETNQYEDTLREMFGINAYMAFTMDKMIQQIVRVVQHLVSEENSVHLYHLYLEEHENKASGGPTHTRHLRQAAESSYQRKAESVLVDENCYKICIYKNSGEVEITLLDQMADQSEDVTEMEKWAQYVERYTSDHVSSDVGSELREQLLLKPVFMSRNVRSWRRRHVEPNKDKFEREPLESEEVEKRKQEEKHKDKESKDDDEINDNDDYDKKDEDIYSKDPLKWHLTEHLQDVSDGKTMIADGVGVRFTVNSLKMHYICCGQETFYVRKSLAKARLSHKRVSLRKHEKFTFWLNEWRKQNVTEEDESFCQSWLLGRNEGIQPSRTICSKVYYPDQSPYYQYNRYIVEYFGTSPLLTITASTAALVTSAAAAITAAVPFGSYISGIGSNSRPSSRPASRPTSRPSSRPSTPAE